MSNATFLRVAPFIFVFLWSSGWVVAKYASPHADPLTFLSVRFALAALVIGVFVLIVSAPQPKTPAEAGHMLASGVMVHGIYLSAVWWAVAQGVPAGISALIAALQPLMAAVLAKPLAGEHVSTRRWIGVVLGFTGIIVVLSPKLAGLDATRLDGIAFPLLINALGMIGVTLGTFHQKRYLATVDLTTLAAWQFVGALMMTLPLAFFLEPMRIEPVPQVAYALFWSVIVLSVVGIALFLRMIRAGSVAKVSAYIYLVPPVAALQAWAMFGETLTVVQLVGMGIVAVGVYLATRN